MKMQINIQIILDAVKKASSLFLADHKKKAINASKKRLLIKHLNMVPSHGVLSNAPCDILAVQLEAIELESLQTILNHIIAELKIQTPGTKVTLSCLNVAPIGSSDTKNIQWQPGATATENYPAVLDKLTQAIDLHFKKLRLPGDYGRLLHISEKALNKSCKQHFHQTLTNLIAERVTNEAKRELNHTAKSVKLIAHELGYYDEFYFSRFFKKNVGLSPRLFRQAGLEII